MRAKFKVDSIEQVQGSRPIPIVEDTLNSSGFRWEPTILYNIKMSPVFGNGDPNHENTKYWAASPSGSFVLGTVNEAAVKEIKLGQEYYVDLTPAI